MINKNDAGSYSENRILNKQDKEVFTEVTGFFHGILFTPQTVSSQIVQGTNYRFNCMYKTGGAKPEKGMAIIGVFQELPSQGGRVFITELRLYCD